MSSEINIKTRRFNPPTKSKKEQPKFKWKTVKKFKNPAIDELKRTLVLQSLKNNRRFVS